MSDLRADVGVIGGSGFYSLLEGATTIQVGTPFGDPSDAVVIADVGHRSVAFLPRHGPHHTIPPHMVNYRANIWALKSVGVRYLISPCAVGSLQPHIQPEHYVICDQFVDRTRGRVDTYFDGPPVTHVSGADPYCPYLRRLAVEVTRAHRVTVHDGGTIVVINGPRFSTKAESRWFSTMGWDVVGMTQYPEAMLALEQQIAVVNISLVTDYDCGLAADGAVSPVSADEVRDVFGRNVERVKSVVLDLARRIPVDLDSPSHRALSGASISA